MGIVEPWLTRFAWLAIGLALAFGGWPRFTDGLAVDRALPVPTYMIAGIVLPKKVYRDATAALNEANPANGDARIAGSEAAMNSGVPGYRQTAALEDALAAAPASMRGWLLLAQARASSDKARAAVALDQALILAPRDFWVAGRRARVAALLWSSLDQDAQERALDQVRLVWEEQGLRPEIMSLLSSPGGAAIVTRAFDGRRDELVKINRWASAMRRSALQPR